VRRSPSVLLGQSPAGGLRLRLDPGLRIRIRLCGDLLGDCPQLREGKVRASRDPAGEWRGGTFRGVGGGAGKIEQFPNLLQGGPGKTHLMGKGGDPLIAGGSHGGQLSRGGRRGREIG
jgi:hypothetical protein